jgi:hypothetical protein
MRAHLLRLGLSHVTRNKSPLDDIKCHWEYQGLGNIHQRVRHQEDDGSFPKLKHEQTGLDDPPPAQAGVK